MMDTLQILHSNWAIIRSTYIQTEHVIYVSSSSRNKMIEEKLKQVITHSRNPKHPANFKIENWIDEPSKLDQDIQPLQSIFIIKHHVSDLFVSREFFFCFQNLNCQILQERLIHLERQLEVILTQNSLNFCTVASFSGYFNGSLKFWFLISQLKFYECCTTQSQTS